MTSLGRCRRIPRAIRHPSLQRALDERGHSRSRLVRSNLSLAGSPEAARPHHGHVVDLSFLEIPVFLRFPDSRKLPETSPADDEDVLGASAPQTAWAPTRMTSRIGTPYTKLDNVFPRPSRGAASFAKAVAPALCPELQVAGLGERKRLGGHSMQTARLTKHHRDQISARRSAFSQQFAPEASLAGVGISHVFEILKIAGGPHLSGDGLYL